MMITGMTLFFVGFVGLVAFVGFLMWERTRGARVLNGMRTQGDRIATRAYRTLVFREIPNAYRHNVIISVRQVTHRAVNALIMFLRTVEKPLARMSSRMHRMQEVGDGGKRTPSPFLKDIGADREKHSQNPEI